MRGRSNDHRFVQNTLRIFCRDLANVLPAAIHLKAWLRSGEGTWVGIKMEPISSSHQIKSQREYSRPILLAIF